MPAKYSSMEKALINEAIDIRYLIFKHYGNADRSMTERVMLRMNPDVTVAEIRQIMFMVGQHGFFALAMKGWSFDRPEPLLKDYPEIAKCGIKHVVREIKADYIVSVEVTAV